MPVRQNSKAGRDTKGALLDAAVRLVARGDGISSMRAIAREAGVTEGAIYKHFTSKDALLEAATAQVVERMLDEKRPLLERAGPVRDAIRSWVEITLASYDAEPDAFTYGLLARPKRVDGPIASTEVFRSQGALFAELFARGVANGECRPLDPDLAVALFSGAMLSVPRAIHEGRLDGPAAGYAAPVFDAAWRLLAAD